MDVITAAVMDEFRDWMQGCPYFLPVALRLARELPDDGLPLLKEWANATPNMEMSDEEAEQCWSGILDWHRKGRACIVQLHRDIRESGIAESEGLWDFLEKWRRKQHLRPAPEDVYSDDFAEWMRERADLETELIRIFGCTPTRPPK